ncbi:hypothetical protein HMPREF9413_1505 [Paenibacillus sp. HGF7]|nr:hypothetical protein HMPREF9413_1505 [Paenibacillus sp. HGF7]
MIFFEEREFSDVFPRFAFFFGFYEKEVRGSYSIRVHYVITIKKWVKMEKM